MIDCLLLYLLLTLQLALINAFCCLELELENNKHYITTMQLYTTNFFLCLLAISLDLSESLSSAALEVFFCGEKVRLYQSSAILVLVLYKFKVVTKGLLLYLAIWNVLGSIINLIITPN